MPQYTVTIPGTASQFLVYAESNRDAIAEALRSHGLTFAPPGTHAAPAANQPSPLGSPHD